MPKEIPKTHVPVAAQGEKLAGRAEAGRYVGNLIPEGTRRATSVNVRLPCLQKDLRTGSVSRDTVNFPSELGGRRSDMFTEFARLVPPGYSTLKRGEVPRDLRLPRSHRVISVYELWVSTLFV